MKKLLLLIAALGLFALFSPIHAAEFTVFSPSIVAEDDGDDDCDGSCPLPEDGKTVRGCDGGCDDEDKDDKDDEDDKTKRHGCGDGCDDDKDDEDETKKRGCDGGCDDDDKDDEDDKTKRHGCGDGCDDDKDDEDDNQKN